MTTAGVVSNQGARLTALALGLQAPTQERAMKGAPIRDEDGKPTDALGRSAFRVEAETFAEIRTAPGEAPRLERVSEKRIRMLEGVFDRLRARQELARDDADMSRIFGRAGQRYADLHYQAGFEALKAFDPTKGFSTARPEMSDEADIRRMDALWAFKEADDMLAGNVGHVLHALPRAIVVRQVLLENRKLADVGRQLSGGTNEKVCSGIAMHELRQGLRALALHFGFLVMAGEPV